MDYTKRLELARQNSRDTNCVGTALYLADKIVDERRIDIDILEKLISNYCEKVDSPLPGDLAALYVAAPNRLLVHVGFVVGANPTQITHRIVSGLRERSSCDEFSEGFREAMPCEIEFYNVDQAPRYFWGGLQRIR